MPLNPLYLHRILNNTNTDIAITIIEIAETAMTVVDVAKLSLTMVVFIVRVSVYGVYI